MMSAEDFRRALDHFGMPQEGSSDNGADAFFGVDPTTIRRWAAGKTAIPDSVEMLLRLMVAHRWRPANVRLRYVKGASRAREAT